jgi:hypothetical protein
MHPAKSKLMPAVVAEDHIDPATGCADPDGHYADYVTRI